MPVFAPFAVMAFWGTIIFFGMRSACIQERGPMIGSLRKIKKGLGPGIWAAVVILYAGALLLAYLDSQVLRRMESPFGIYTGLGFIPLVLGDMLLAARLFLSDEPSEDPDAGES